MLVLMISLFDILTRSIPTLIVWYGYQSMWPVFTCVIIAHILRMWLFMLYIILARVTTQTNMRERKNPYLVKAEMGCFVND